MPNEYVPIEDRVRVVYDGTPVGTDMCRLEALAEEDIWRLVHLGAPKGTQDLRADIIRATIRLACEAMRERCAEYVEALEPAESHAKPDVARAIRELEL